MKSGKIIWHFPLLGFLNALLTFLTGLIFLISVVGIPLGKGLFQYAKYLLNPAETIMLRSEEKESKNNDHWTAFGMFVKMLYFPISLLLVLFTMLQILGLSLTYVYYPLAKKLFKSLSFAFNPVDSNCLREV